MIIVVDYGMGNLGSVVNMLKRVGKAVQVSRDERVIKAGERLILPGVGAFDHGMLSLGKSGLQDALTERVMKDRVPVLGICLGMQLMSRRSEEGQLPGLGWVDAETVRFRLEQRESRLKIPHMGWNTVRVCKGSDLLSGISEQPRFYFVHSYHVLCGDEADVLFRTQHGCEFVSGFQRGNITGVQFHPEKSHKFGMTLLRNWASS